MVDLPGFDLDAFVRATLAEGSGRGRGRHLNVIPAEARVTGVMVGLDAIVVAGQPPPKPFRA